MSGNSIEDLLEKLSCDFVLADPGSPQTLSTLLPLLKQIHTGFMRSDETKKAGLVLSIRRMIESVLREDSSAAGPLMKDIETVISSLIETNGLSAETEKREPEDREKEETGSATGTPRAEDPASRPTARQEALAGMEQGLDQFSTLIAQFCPGEIPDLGAMLNALEALINISEPSDFRLFHEVVLACRGYVENMTLENIYNTMPIEQGVTLLSSILKHLKSNRSFDFDYSDVMEMLTPGPENVPGAAAKKAPDQAPADTPSPEPDALGNPREPGSLTETPASCAGPVSEDDLQILADFVEEALENLETIEINLIDLEQDPSNTDIINDIFRPFHTIKGVSGFLSLTKINILAHTTENLLDSARNGDFLINDTATDAILSSVDTLKKLIARIKEGLAQKELPPDDDIDVSKLQDYLKKLQSSLTKGEKMPLGEILVSRGEISPERLDQALEIQKSHPDRKIGEILVQEKSVQPRQVASALMEQKSSRKAVAAQVKVSTEKLDDLVDYAGELVIAQSMLRQQASDNPALFQSVAQLGQIVTNMQSIAMSMRMIPIKSTFMKMIRLVRDLSKKSGKNVALEMFGEDTEIDRNVVDALYEPMVHMIRNSVDHGIEPEAIRREQGKPLKGKITLSAYHKGGNIIIEIQDDGKGLDKDRILDKAMEKGLISGSEQMTDAQIYDLILQPGFSTAKTITDVSGRGVGMDVVKDGIEKFRGHLNIESRKNNGTRFTIVLPLTLAIIDGMLVRVGDQKYVIPTTAIQKAFKPEKSECYTVENKGEMVKDRGHLIPVVRLNEIFSQAGEKESIWKALVVIVESNDRKKALMIDELLGKDEYVIKSLGGNLEDVAGVTGGAILADGKVGLILDVHGIFELSENDSYHA